MTYVTPAAGGGSAAGGAGLPGKHPDVKPPVVTVPGAAFDDISENENRAAIEALAARGVISGMGDGTFAPEKTMTRAEFATIVTRALALPAHDTGAFTDVAPDAWYAGYIGTANEYGIVYGVGDDRFDPGGTISRQEAACMVARAAGLCGLDPAMTDVEIRNMLAQFGDYRTIADWAKDPWRSATGRTSSTRARWTWGRRSPSAREIAQMLYNLLTRAKLL
jgi:hypothetical protein